MKNSLKFKEISEYFENNIILSKYSEINHFRIQNYENEFNIIFILRNEEIKIFKFRNHYDNLEILYQIDYNEDIYQKIISINFDLFDNSDSIKIFFRYFKKLLRINFNN